MHQCRVRLAQRRTSRCEMSGAKQKRRRVAALQSGLVISRLALSRFNQSECFVTLLYNLGAQGIVESIPGGFCLIDGAYGGVVSYFSENSHRTANFVVCAAALLGQLGLGVVAPPILFRMLLGPKPVVLLEQLDKLHYMDAASDADLSQHIYYVLFQLHKLGVNN